MSYWVSEQSKKIHYMHITTYGSEPGKLDNHPKDQEYSQVKNSHKHTSISKE